MLLYLQALWQIVRFQYYILRGDFASLYTKVRTCSCSPDTFSSELAERICRAIDRTCVWYPKRVLCLQRSAATACLLRTYGVPAQMVLGVQKFPLKAHAWVELNGRVVNDKSYTAEMYAVFDRC